MFPPQREVADFEYPRGPLKRFLEEETAAEAAQGVAIGFTEHRNKRLHTLPFRTSPTARKWMLPMGSPAEGGDQPHPPAMTPPSSFSDNASHHRTHQQYLQESVEVQPFMYSHDHLRADIPAVIQSGDMDMDMATDDTDAMHESAHAPYEEHGDHHLVPGPAQPDQDSIVASRMPTPIQPTFAVQVRGNNWGGAAGNIMHNNLPTPSAVQATIYETDMQAAYSDRSVPRSLDHPAAMNDWSMVQNRSLPSPISESGGEDTGSPEMVLDSMALHGHVMDHPTLDHIHHHHHDHEAMDALPDQMSAMSSSPVPMSASSPIRSSMDNDPAATPSPKKGHSRSRHTIVAWTQQPGMKRSFSIGYRADCEKCRNRVPGHFNHIIVS